MKSVLYVCVLATFLQFTYGDDGTTIPPMQGGSAKMRTEIRKAIFGEYDKMNLPDKPDVKFGLNIVNIDVDEVKGTIEADVWLKMAWTDNRLQWDNVSTGVNVLRVGPNEIWKPDMTLYNSANPAEMVSCSNVNPLIYSSGYALFVPPCHVSAYCNLTLEEYPLGEQSCKLKFGSWVYDGLIMDIQFDGKPKADVSTFLGNKYEITKNIATRKDTYYPCCAEPYTSLTYNLGFKRKTIKNTCEKA